MGFDRRFGNTEQRRDSFICHSLNDRWLTYAKINAGRVFRAVSRHGTPSGKGTSENVIWYVVRRCAIHGQLPPAVLRRALEMIESKLDSGLSIESLAGHCQMGVHHFRQLVKASTGRTPYQYFLDLRVRRAKYFLKETSLPFAEIAYKVGFASQSHCSTAFRQQTQLTPGQYRQSAR